MKNEGGATRILEKELKKIDERERKGPSGRIIRRKEAEQRPKINQKVEAPKDVFSEPEKDEPVVSTQSISSLIPDEKTTLPPQISLGPGTTTSDAEAISENDESPDLPPQIPLGPGTTTDDIPQTGGIPPTLDIDLPVEGTTDDQSPNIYVSMPTDIPDTPMHPITGIRPPDKGTPEYERYLEDNKRRHEAYLNSVEEWRQKYDVPEGGRVFNGQLSFPIDREDTVLPEEIRKTPPPDFNSPEYRKANTAYTVHEGKYVPKEWVSEKLKYDNYLKWKNRLPSAYRNFVETKDSAEVELLNLKPPDWREHATKGTAQQWRIDEGKWAPSSWHDAMDEYETRKNYLEKIVEMNIKQKSTPNIVPF